MAASAEQVKIFGGPGYSRYVAQYNPLCREYIDFFDIGIELRYTASPKPGLIAGLGIEGSLTKHLQIELNAFYFSKGCHFDVFTYSEISQLTYPEKKMSYRLTGISVPFLLKAKLLPESSPYLLGGVECSYILAHKSEERRLDYWSMYPPGQDLWGEDVMERTSRLDFGLVLRGGFEIKVQNVFVFIEARYSFGLLNILAGEHGYWLESINTRMEGVLIGIKI